MTSITIYSSLSTFCVPFFSLNVTDPLSRKIQENNKVAFYTSDFATETRKRARSTIFSLSLSLSWEVDSRKRRKVTAKDIKKKNGCITLGFTVPNTNEERKLLFFFNIFIFYLRFELGAQFLIDGRLGAKS
jgi:hypothetical protein